MTHNSDGSIYFEGYGRRRRTGAELCAVLRVHQVKNKAYQMPPSLFKTDRILRHGCIPITLRNIVRSTADLPSTCGILGSSYTLIYLRGDFGGEAGDLAIPVVSEDGELLYHR